MTQLIERRIGGETGRRRLFGFGVTRARRIGWGIVFAVGIVVVILFREWGLAATLVAAALVWVGTVETATGTISDRVLARRRFATRVKHGLTTFRAVQTRPREVEARAAGRRPGRAEWNAWRDWPDGMQGFQWLWDRPGTPGIGWHRPVGEEPQWLTVTYPLGGQIRGLQRNEVINSRAGAFGKLLSTWASETSLPGRLQIITRVQPVDTAAHERWVADEVDPEAPAELSLSYKELVDKLGSGALRARHYAVVQWPLTAMFFGAAARHGVGQRGWLALMAEEIDLAHRDLATAGLSPGRALSAAQTAGVVRHLQLPSWPIDQASRIEASAPWTDMRERWSYVSCSGGAPDGSSDQWLHRTAQVMIGGVTTGLRDPLWMLPLVSHLRKNVIRTISTQIEPVAARHALADAREDLVYDLADMQAEREKGKLATEDLISGRDAAAARRDDLRPGKGHNGAAWAMHITVSARDEASLRESCLLMEEAASAAGLNQLRWLDSQQLAAQSATWPFARGVAPTPRSAGAVILGALAGRGHKESLT
jgi:hypothetical protein